MAYLVDDERGQLYAVVGGRTVCTFGDVAEMAGAQAVLIGLDFEVRQLTAPYC